MVVLVGIVEVRDNCCNMVCRSMVYCVNYYYQFYQVVIGWGIGGLNDKYIVIMYIFVDLYCYFIIREMRNSSIIKGNVQVICNMLGQFGYCVISKQFYIRYGGNFRVVFSFLVRLDFS